jgi:hypothetical protein
VKATNPGGPASGSAPTLQVRAPPLLTNACSCAAPRTVPPPLPVTVGDRLPLAELEDGVLLDAPRITAEVPAPRITMHWLRCRRNHCAPILRATGDSYTATPRDIGYSLRVRLTARNPLGSYTVDLVTPGRLAVRAPPARKRRRP